MSKCDHCGKGIKDPQDVYTYKNRALCEDCAVMLQAGDYSSTHVMGCDGPVGRRLPSDAGTTQG